MICEFGDSKVEDLDERRVSRADEQIVGLDVAMDDAGFVRVGEPLRRLAYQDACFVERQTRTVVEAGP